MDIDACNYKSWATRDDGSCTYRTPHRCYEDLDNDGDYEAGNVKWSTKEEQDNNRRTNRRITYDGKTMTMTEWARSIGLSPKTLSTRIVDNGWTVEEALTTPKGAKRGSKEVAMEKVAC